MWVTSAALAVAPEDRRELERIVRSGKTERRVVLRARIVLGAAAGKSNAAQGWELIHIHAIVMAARARPER